MGDAASIGTQRASRLRTRLATLSPAVVIRDGDYPELAGAALVMIHRRGE